VEICEGEGGREGGREGGVRTKNPYCLDRDMETDTDTKRKGG